MLDSNRGYQKRPLYQLSNNHCPPKAIVRVSRQHDLWFIHKCFRILELQLYSSFKNSNKSLDLYLDCSGSPLRDIPAFCTWRQIGLGGRLTSWFRSARTAAPRGPSASGRWGTEATLVPGDQSAEAMLASRQPCCGPAMESFFSNKLAFKIFLVDYFKYGEWPSHTRHGEKSFARAKILTSKSLTGWRNILKPFFGWAKFNLITKDGLIPNTNFFR